MKSKVKIFLFLIVNQMVILSFAQSDTKSITGKFYITEVDVKVTNVNFNDMRIKGDYYIAKRGTKFTAIQVVDENNEVLIKFWNFDKKAKKPKQFQPGSKSNNTYNYIDATVDGQYFTITTEDLDRKTSAFNGSGHSITYGFSIIPIKLRPGNITRTFQYTNGFTLGVNFGYEYAIRSRKQQSISALGGVGISSVEISPETTNQFIDDKVQTSAAFTPSVGIVYTYEKFQAGLFIGMDKIAGELGKHWIYQKKPWIGVGLGFTIFQKNKTEAAENQNQ